MTSDRKFEADCHDRAHDLSEAYDEADRMAALFAACCPGLEILATLHTNGFTGALYRLRPAIENLHGERAAEIRNTYDPDEAHSWPLLDPDLEPSPGW